MGGHCLPVDPFYLGFKAREHDFYPEFIELAGKVNRAQPAYCVDRIARALNEAGKPVRGSRVLILGVSYKAGVGDTRESPALKILKGLRELGADVTYHDPHVPDLPELGLSSEPLAVALETADLTAIVTAHPELDFREVVSAAPLVVDFRGVTRDLESANLLRL
jgi:UDP-N-acetyl-D-glucosamine dehydrogenase